MNNHRFVTPRAIQSVVARREAEILGGLHIAIGTRSSIDLGRAGAWAYAQHPSSDASCVSYAIGEEPVKRWCPGEPIPTEIAAHVSARLPIIAYDAGFERVIWRHVLRPRYGWPEAKIGTMAFYELAGGCNRITAAAPQSNSVGDVRDLRANLYTQTSPQTTPFGTHYEPFILAVVMTQVLAGPTKNHCLSTQANDTAAVTDAHLLMKMSRERMESQNK